MKSRFSSRTLPGSVGRSLCCGSACAYKRSKKHVTRAPTTLSNLEELLFYALHRFVVILLILQPGSGNRRSELGLRREVLHGEEVVRSAHLQPLRDTGTSRMDVTG